VLTPTTEVVISLLSHGKSSMVGLLHVQDPSIQLISFLMLISSPVLISLYLSSILPCGCHEMASWMHVMVTQGDMVVVVVGMCRMRQGGELGTVF
jgi:hypothetical protein